MGTITLEYSFLLHTYFLETVIATNLHYLLGLLTKDALMNWDRQDVALTP